MIRIFSLQIYTPVTNITIYYHICTFLTHSNISTPLQNSSPSSRSIQLIIQLVNHRKSLVKPILHSSNPPQHTIVIPTSTRLLEATHLHYIQRINSTECSWAILESNRSLSIRTQPHWAGVRPGPNHCH